MSINGAVQLHPKALNENGEQANGELLTPIEFQLIDAPKSPRWWLLLLLAVPAGLTIFISFIVVRCSQ